MAMKTLFLTSIAALFLATGAASYLLSWSLHPQEMSLDDWIEDMDFNKNLGYCLRMVQREDDYALFANNKQRIVNWCDDYKKLFRASLKAEVERPLDDQMTDTERKEMYTCLGRIDTQFAPSGRHRTIEDVFDAVFARVSAMTECYPRALEAWEARTKAQP